MRVGVAILRSDNARLIRIGEPVRPSVAELCKDGREGLARGGDGEVGGSTRPSSSSGGGGVLDDSLSWRSVLRPAGRCRRFMEASKSSNSACRPSLNVALRVGLFSDSGSGEADRMLRTRSSFERFFISESWRSRRNASPRPRDDGVLGVVCSGLIKSGEVGDAATAVALLVTGVEGLALSDDREDTEACVFEGRERLVKVTLPSHFGRCFSSLEGWNFLVHFGQGSRGISS